MQIICNDETFTLSEYNGFSILIRDRDGYVNGAKMIKDINQRTDKNKRFNHILENKGFHEYKDMMQKHLSSTETKVELIYELGQIYTDAKGTYIHPKLVNYIAMWCDMQYAIIVSEIMDKINDDTKQGTQNQFSDLLVKDRIRKQQNIKLVAKNKELKERNEQLEESNQKLEEETKQLKDQMKQLRTKQKEIKNQYQGLWETALDLMQQTEDLKQQKQQLQRAIKSNTITSKTINKKSKVIVESSESESSESESSNSSDSSNSSSNFNSDSESSQ